MSDDKLVISASQLGTFSDCERKWWLERVARMPRVPKPAQVFGTVLHACLERWMSANEQGRVPSPPIKRCACTIRTPHDALWSSGTPLAGQVAGAPVEVFPAGWEEVDEHGTRARVTPNEAALIRALVAQAVERGVVQRGDGRAVEREVKLPVVPGAELWAYLDVFVPPSPVMPDDKGRELVAPQVHDHKTFSESGSRYLRQARPESPNYVGRDAQLLTYAAATSVADGWTGPVVVRHNQFPKYPDGRGPRTVEAAVPPEAWAARWAEVVAAAERMLQVRRVERWDDVPGPYGTDACQKYGGCAFRGICGRVQTPDGYRANVQDRVAEMQGRDRPNVALDSRRTQKEMSATNDIFARARAARAQLAPAAPAPPSAAPAPQVAPAAPAAGQLNGGVPAAPPAPPPFSAPWGNANCTACRGTGFATSGRPCPVCDALARHAKRPTSESYAITGSLQEGYTAVAKPERAEEVARLGLPLEWSSRQAAPAAPPAPAQPQQEAKGPAQAVGSTVPSSPAPAVAPAPAEPAQPAPPPPEKSQPKGKKAEKAPEDAAETRGRKPIGVTVLIGCAQFKGPDRPQVLAQSLLEQVGAELARDMGAASYWELEPFKRRERIRQRAQILAEGLGRSVVLVPGVRDPDVDNLVGALLPYADTVVEGVR